MPSAGVGRSRVEDYLTTIYRFEEALGVAKITDISRELKVSPATASKVIEKLEKKGFVRRIKYRYVQLTSEGREAARRIIRKHRIVEVFLSKVLGFNEIESHVYAHHLEHLPDVVIERIFALVGRPRICPHGNAIPDAMEAPEEAMNLKNAKKGQTCIIKRIAGEFTEVLEHIYNLGLRVDDTVTVLEQDDRCVVLVNAKGLRIEVPSYYTRFIFVRC